MRPYPESVGRGQEEVGASRLRSISQRPWRLELALCSKPVTLLVPPSVYRLRPIGRRVAARFFVLFWLFLGFFRIKNKLLPVPRETPITHRKTQNDPHKLRRLRRPTGPQRAAMR